MSRLLRGRHATHESRGIRAGTRTKPVIERKSRGNLFRSRRKASATNPIAEAVAPVKEAIMPQNKTQQVSAEDKIHGLGSRIAGRLSGRPRQEAAGKRMMKGTHNRGSNRIRRLVGMKET
jgi:hypothetical protein